MQKTSISDEELVEILETARFAPSAHNTQSWLVKRQKDRLHISIDEAHALGPGDPVGRQTTIGLGIFCEAIVVSARKIGLNAYSVEFSDMAGFVRFQRNKKTDADEVKLLRQRVSDRSIYKKTELGKKQKELIQKAWSGQGVRIRVRQDESFINKLADLTASGISLALSNPAFRQELSRLLILPWSSKKRGISVKSLYIPYVLGLIQPVFLKLGLNTGKEAELEKKRWPSASGVVLITTEGDFHQDWFSAGRAYLRASLAIESLGLSQATSAAAVEASTIHEEVEKMLGTKQRLQAVIRVGAGRTKRYISPRLSAEELITLS